MVGVIRLLNCKSQTVVSKLFHGLWKFGKHSLTVAGYESKLHVHMLRHGRTKSKSSVAGYESKLHVHMLRTKSTKSKRSVIDLNNDFKCTSFFNLSDIMLDKMINNRQLEFMYREETKETLLREKRHQYEQGKKHDAQVRWSWENRAVGLHIFRIRAPESVTIVRCLSTYLDRIRPD